jgi:hypothetical protein
VWFSFAWIDVILIYMLGLRLHCYNSGVSRRKLRSQGFHIVLTKKKKREIFTSKLLVYYVVLQVYKHIGISPPAPDASLISERIHVHDFCSETLQEWSKYFKNNLCSF